MRLHRLELTAFGPFAGTETVDFDALTESGLFLLRGATGAGKTSILDGVCFALYGSVPGTRQRGGALRSDHARPELLTRVILELTLAGRRLRITRQPEQRRPKQRGDGTTLVRPQTLLEEWDATAGGWSARSGSHQEIGQELHDLLGMSRDQFCQVVLLPQGEFSRFLHAPAQERRELLGRLFDTRRFTGAERWLQERTRQSERTVREAEAELAAFTHRLDQAAGELTHAVPPLAGSTSAEPPAEVPAPRRAAAMVPPSPARIHPDAHPASPAFSEGNPAAARALTAPAAPDGGTATAPSAATGGPGGEAPTAPPAATGRNATPGGDIEWNAPAHPANRTAMPGGGAARTERAAAAEPEAASGTTTPSVGAAPTQRAAAAEPEAASGTTTPSGRAAPTQRTAAAEPEAASGTTTPSGRAAPAEPVADGRGGERVLVVDREAWAALLRVEARERAEIAASEEAVRERGRLVAAERAARAARLAERQQTYARAVEEQAQLSAQQTAELARGVRLALNRRAEAVAPLARLAGRAEADAAASRREADALRARLPEPERELDAEQLTARERELRGEAGRLEALLETEAAQRSDAVEVKRLERQREDVERQHREASTWLAEVWPERHAKARAALAEARDEAGAVEGLASELERVQAQAAAARLRDTLEFQAGHDRAAALAAREAEQRLRDVWLDLKERRLAGMAAELASALVPGQPCAVCGGTEHPDPARSVGEPVTPEAERSAEVDYLAARERTEAAQTALSGVEQKLAAARAGAGPKSAEELGVRSAELAARHREAEHQAVAAVRAEEELALLEQQHERHLALATRTANSLAVLDEQLDQSARRQAAAQARLEEARAGAASVAERARALAALADACAAAAEQERSAAALAAQAEAATAEALEAAADHGFDSLAEADVALLGPEHAQRLEQESARYREATARVRLVLDDASLAADAALPPAPAAETRAELDAAEQALRAAAVRSRAARQRSADLDALSTELMRRSGELTPLLDEHAVLSELAALVAGTGRSNRKRMSLENYVLAARLESVAASAGARLEVMSGGRYTLVHSDDRARGNARSGLGLKVVDAWTGQERDTATLSGGESFFASLALALGLADVVTDEAGGVPLDTLFIDEGFGSLDAETLEDVLNVLDSLRERDRAVGIVSHVADLRDRIPNQLEVRKTRTGSTLRRVLA